MTPILRPLRDLVYVRQDPLPEKDSGGRFFLPDSTKKHIQVRYGTVLAVGPGKLVCKKEVLLPYGTLDLTNATDVGELPIPAKCPVGASIIDPFCKIDVPLSLGHNNETLEVWVTRLLPMSVKPGDRVAFPDYWGFCVGLDTDPSLLIGPASGEEGLLAVIDQ